jgi:hypothetical protein
MFIFIEKFYPILALLVSHKSSGKLIIENRVNCLPEKITNVFESKIKTVSQIAEEAINAI